VPERRDPATDRTVRPIDADDAAEALPTVAEIVAMPAVADGLPELLVGGPALEEAVRWVHVSDLSDVARLLNGGELLLSTGAGWPADPGELTAFIDSLVEAGLAALVLELGAHYRYVPAVVVAAAETRGLALVALHREVKFVTITEAVHRRIISEQTTALRARDEVHERFAELSLRGSPADYVVQQLARALRSTVVLENLAHEVVAAEVDRPGEEAVLGEWELRSREAHRAAGLRARDDAAGRRAGEWLVVPVEARGARWGHLVALPGPSHPAGRRQVLRQGAIALALGRLADPDADEWTRLGQQRLVDALLGGRFASLADATARLEAAGLQVAGRRLHGLAVTGAGTPGGDVVAAALRRVGATGVAGVRGGVLAVLCSVPASTDLDDKALRTLAGELVHQGGPAGTSSPGGPVEQVTLHVGTPADDVGGLLAAVQEALVLSAVRSPRREQGPVIRRVEDRPLLQLITSMRGDHRLQQHSERLLAPLIEHDLRRGGDLLAVLAAAVAHPGNRTAAAAASHLSRSVFYQRLGLIAELLDADLDDGETLTALHLALLTRSVNAAGGRRTR
jgi:purine catabolism regulator